MRAGERPHAGLGHNLAVFMIECQIRPAIDAMRHVRAAALAQAI